MTVQYHNEASCQQLNIMSPELSELCPDWGKPTVRDRREASANVAYGDTVNPARNRKGGDGNPTPKGKRAQDLSRPNPPTL